MNYTQNSIKSKNLFLIISVAASFIADLILLIFLISYGYSVAPGIIATIVQALFLAKCFVINYRFKYSSIETIIYIAASVILMFIWVSFFFWPFSQYGYMTSITTTLFVIMHLLSIVAVLINTQFARKQNSIIPASAVSGTLIVSVIVLGIFICINGVFGQGAKVEVVANGYKKLNGDSYQVVEYQGKGNTIIIPSEFEGLPVTSFQFPDASSYTNITDIYIENTEELIDIYFPEEKEVNMDINLHIPANLLGDYQDYVYSSTRANDGREAWKMNNVVHFINSIHPLKEENDNLVYINFQYTEQSLNSLLAEDTKDGLLSTWVAPKGTTFTVESLIEYMDENGECPDYLRYYDANDRDHLSYRFTNDPNKEMLCPLVDSNGNLLEGRVINESIESVTVEFEKIYSVSFAVDNDTAFLSKNESVLNNGIVGTHHYCVYSKLDELIAYDDRPGFDLDIKHVTTSGIAVDRMPSIGNSLKNYVTNTTNNLSSQITLQPIWTLKAPSIEAMNITVENTVRGQTATSIYADQVEIEAQMSGLLDIEGISYTYTWEFSGNGNNTIPSGVVMNRGIATINCAIPNLHTGRWRLTVQAYSPTGTNQITSLVSESVSMSANLTVNKAPLTVTVNEEITYGDAPLYGATYTGFRNGDDASNLGGTIETECEYQQYDSVGLYPILVAGYTSDNYSITHVTGTLTVNQRVVGVVWTAPSSLVYSGTAKVPTATLSNIVNEDDCTFDSTLAFGNSTNVGTFRYVVSNLGNDNYKLPSNCYSPTYSITRLNLLYTSSSVVVNYANTLTYNGDEQTQIVSNLTINGITIPETNYTITNNTATTAGTHSLLVTGNNNLTGSREIEFTIAQLDLSDVNNVVDVVLANPLTYTGETQTQNVSSVTVNGFTVDLDDYTITNNIATTAGTRSLIINGSNNLTGYRYVNYTINKANLTITATPTSITYGDDVPSYQVEYQGFVNSEDSSVLTGELLYTCSYTQYSNVGRYSITPYGYSSNNYNFNYVSGTLTVNQKEVTVNWTEPSSLVYSGTAKVPTVTVSGLVNDDECSANIAVESGSNTNVGIFTYRATSLSNLNYILSSERVSPEYQITELDLSNDSNIVEVEFANILTYNGIEQTQSVSRITINGIEIANTNYTITNNEATDVGTYSLIINGSDNLENSRDIEFTIAQLDLSNTDNVVEVEFANILTYNFIEQTQNVSKITINEIEIANTNYTITNNVATTAGTHLLTINGSGNLTGAREIEFTISQLDLSGVNNVVDVVLANTLTYTGETQTQNVSSVTVNGFMVDLDDYTITNNTATAAGNYSLFVVGNNNLAGSRMVNYTISRLDLSNTDNVVGVEFANTLTYNGRSQVQNVSRVTINGVTISNANYTITDNTATDAGTYLLIINGSNNLENSRGVEFTIAQLDLSNDSNIVEVEFTNTLTYNGTEQTQIVSRITINRIEIPSNNYNITSNTATTAGTHSLTITGNNNLTGSRSVNFTISQLDLSNTNNVVEVEFENILTYNGIEQTQIISSVKVNGFTVEPEDYAITNNAVTTAGTHSLTINGSGNLTGSRDIDFTINRANLTITAIDNEITYGDDVPSYQVEYQGFVNGETNTDLDGTLRVTCDYEQYDSVGTYQINLEGYTSNNYNINYVSGTLTVNPKALEATIVLNPSYVYGEEITIEVTFNDSGSQDEEFTDYHLVYGEDNSTEQPADVGSYLVKVISDNQNYTITYPENVYLVITGGE